MDDERLRRLYQDGLGPTPVHRPGCPGPDALHALVSGHGDEGARLAHLDHVMACTDCRREFELLRSIRTAEETGGARRRAVPLALAASIAGLVALGTVWQLARQPAPVFRSGAVPTVRVVEPVGDVPAANAFRWTSAEGDAQYAVELLDPDGAVLFSATTRDTVLATPDAIAFAPLVDYRWTLTVVTLERGRETLGPTVFRVR